MEEIVVVPACGFDVCFDGSLGFAGVGFEEVERPAAQGGEVFRGVAGAGGACGGLNIEVRSPAMSAFRDFDVRCSTFSPAQRPSDAPALDRATRRRILPA